MPKQNKKWGVFFAPEAQQSLLKGIELLCIPLAATIGPVGRSVAVAPFNKSKSGNNPPEILVDAGTIARRIVEIPDRGINAGAMLLRSMVWDMRDQVGDGSATAAVLARAFVRSCARMNASGVNPTSMRKGIEKGVQIVSSGLKNLASPLATVEDIQSLAKSNSSDLAMANLLAEIFDIIGTEGTVVVEEYASTYLEREYVEGVCWETGLASTHFVTNPTKQEAVINNPLIAIADLEITTVDQVITLLQQAMQVRADSLAIIAAKIEGQALGLLLLNKHKIPIVAITAPGLTLSRSDILQDIAALTGATVVTPSAAMKMENFKSDYFGRARRIIASTHRFTIVGARGNPREIRKRSIELKKRIESSDTLDVNITRRRLANLAGGVAILKIGAIYEVERKMKIHQAEDAIRSIQAALKEGVVPGGGAAYIACIPAVERAAKDASDSEIACGLIAVTEALKAPLQQISENAGYNGQLAVAQAQQAGLEYGFDALSGRIVNMREAGIIDPTRVVRLALEKAASLAAMYLTTDTFVIPKTYPPISGKI